MSKASMRIRGRAVIVGAAAAAMILLPVGCGQEPEAGPSAAGRRAQGEAPLNVLLITMDTTRADALGCYGQRIETTPNIDRLAAEGALFEQVVASAPNTLPSHASILTGKQPYAHGTRSNFGYVLSEGNVTLAEVLRSRGYRTAAEIAAPVIGRRTKIDQGFDHYRDLESFDVRRKVVSFHEGSGPEQVEMPEREAGDITLRGLEFLRANRDQTFFLWLHYFDPHQIHRPPEGFRRLRPDSPYHAEVMYVDYNVGQIVSELTRLGLRARTLLVLTSDHGEGLGEHGEGTHSYFVFDTTMRVPLIFWGPELVSKGRRVSSLVRSVDIAPTILDLLGLPALSGVQGVSLRPLMVGISQDLGLTGYGESIEARASFGTSILRFLREGRWKYIHKVNPRLFDVLADPGELHDLASARADITDGLRARLYQLIAEAPAKPAGAEVTLDAETLSQLMALGYVGPSSAPEIDDEAAELELMGSDPTTMTWEISLLAQAQGKLKKEDYQAAAEMFGDLWRKYPDSASLLKHLIDALSALERYDEAIPLLRRAIELDPGSLGHYTLLAAMVQEKGDVEEAERLLQLAVEMDPCAAPPRVSYSNLLSSLERYAQQLQLLEAGVEQCPDSQGFLNDYAYALATCPEDALRDGSKALRIAQRVVSEAGGVAHPSYLDTLAAAYAEVGEFGKAVEASRKAVALLQNREMPEDVIAAFQENLELYQAGRPVRAQAQRE